MDTFKRSVLGAAAVHWQTKRDERSGEMEAHAESIRIGIRTQRASRRLRLLRERGRERRRQRAIRAHAVRAGSPRGPADRMLFLPPKAY